MKIGGPTAQQINRQIINEVMAAKKNQTEEEDKDLLAQLPDCPLHPDIMANQKCRKCRKIREQYEDLKAEKYEGYTFKEEKIKHGFDLDAAAEEYLASNAAEGFPINCDPSKGNLNDMLRNNILRSQYFKIDLYEKKTYHEVINEIDIHVGYVEPWTLGTHGVPSTLFCCLYKLMIMRLTMKQLFGLIKETNAFTRCAGFLYIRFLCKPELLWHFLSPYMMDEQEFVPTPATEETTTIGEYVEKLLSDQNYYGTILPRIPVQIEKEIQKRLLLVPEKRERRKNNLSNLSDFKIGKQCYVFDQSISRWELARITEVAATGITIVYYTEDGDTTKTYDLSEVLPCLDDRQNSHERGHDSYDDDDYHDKKHKKRKHHDSRSRSSSRDSRRRKRHKESKKHKRRRSDSREKVQNRGGQPTFETRDLEEEVKRLRMNQASSSTRAGYSMKASSYKTTLSLAMPVGIKKRESRSPTPERKFVEIENKAKDRKTEKILKVDDEEMARQNKLQNERLERLKKLYQS